MCVKETQPNPFEVIRRQLDEHAEILKSDVDVHAILRILTHEFYIVANLKRMKAQSAYFRN